MEQFYRDGAKVVDQDGATIGEVVGQSGTGDTAHLVVQVPESDRTVIVPYSLINRQQSGKKKVVLTGTTEDYTRGMLGLDERETAHIELHEEYMVPHVREESRGRIFVDKTVDTVPHHEKVDVGTDVVTVDRVAVDQIFDEPPATRQDGDTLIVPVIEEVLVVEKRYRVAEEVRVTKRRETRTETVEDTLRKETVIVTEEGQDGTSRTVE